jgi:hypothetical protein
VSGPLATTCVGGGGPKRAGPLFVPIQVRGGGASPPPPVGPDITIQPGTISDSGFQADIAELPATGWWNLYVFSDAGLTSLIGTISANQMGQVTSVVWPDVYPVPPLDPETNYWAVAKQAQSDGTAVGDYGNSTPFTTLAAP